MPVLAVLAAFGLAFGLIGGAMAFVIVYAEYQRHGFRGRRFTSEALRAGIVAFLVFFLSAMAIGLLIARLSQPR